MNQKTPLDQEETVNFAYFARRNPAIRFSITPNHLREFRYRKVLTLCGSGFGLLPTHYRP